jgi:PTS system nitrogen regulatory IIA component
MQLSSLLDARFMKLNLPARTKNEVIQVLLDEMFTHYHFQLSREEVHQAISAREALKGTVFASGLAVPHARIELFNDILIGVATLKTPIEEDGIKIRMVVLILTSKTTSNLYLNCLAAFTRISKDETTFSSLTKAANADEMINAIQVMNIEVKPELTVDHIMVAQVIGVPPTATVRQVIDSMCENDISYVPVIGSNGTFMGEISVLEVMRLGIPNYAQMIGNVNFLKAFEPMEELLAKEETILARDIMEPPTNTFSRQTSVVEAVFTFTKTRKRHIPVVDNRQIVGLVSYMDILTKVLRA